MLYCTNMSAIAIYNPQNWVQVLGITIPQARQIVNYIQNGMQIYEAVREVLNNVPEEIYEAIDRWREHIRNEVEIDHAGRIAEQNQVMINAIYKDDPSFPGNPNIKGMFIIQFAS